MPQRVIFFLLLLLGSWIGALSCNSTTTSPPPPSPPPAPSPPAPTPPPPAISVHFFSFGDWGSGNDNQRAVADRTFAVCQSSGCDFGLTLGDNFYNSGVSSVDDPQWQTKYQDMYGALGIPFYALLGNHDWDGTANPQAQVDFDLLDKDPWWRMPAFYYSFSYPTSGESLVEIFVLNSNNFAGDATQQNWLGQALAASQAPWRIVAFHHPILSNSTVHPPDEKGIYSSLRPIICGKVQLILSGHDHLLSHLRDSSEGCGHDQMIVGTGGANLYSGQSDPTVLFFESSFGLGFFEIDATQMSFRFFRADGSEAYTIQWTNPF